MEVFPAVDILSGNCVQLVGGDRRTATVYGSPLINARRWIQDGASNLHIVNLDGAFAASDKNVGQIRELIDTTDVFVQVGGGIRSLQDARGWLNCGVSRIILSTFATREPAVIRQLSNEFGSERIMAGVDARKGELAISGWQELAGDYIGWAEKFEELGAGSLLYTNVDVEGKESGIDGAPVQKLIDAVSIPVIVADGVTTPSDVLLLKQLGANGCILGSALYSGKISLKEALEAAV